MKDLSIRYAVGAVVFNEEREFLVLKRNPLRYNGWGLVKGGVDEGENEIQALERETKEEIGVSVSLENIIDMEYKTAYYDNTQERIVLVSWYFVVIPRSSNLILELEEWVDSKWSSYEEAWHKLTWQTQQMVLKKAQALVKSLE